MELQALLVVRKDSYQIQEMRERIATEGENAMLAQVQVYRAAFLSIFDAFLGRLSQMVSVGMRNTGPLRYLKFGNSRVDGVLPARSLLSLLFE
jgi:non-ribosomal peptide synthetase component E (peptide arylation enzyme)